MADLDAVVLLVVPAPADADVRVRPVVSLPVREGLLVVELALDAKVHPHFPQVGHVLGGWDVVAQLILYLDHDDGPAILVQERRDHSCQRSEVDLYL
jgi:hypothetical protein